MTDLRKAAEMALEYLEYLNELDIAGLDHEVHTNALRQALAQPEWMVDIVPPATQRDRWMYEQGRLAERDTRTHAQPEHPLDKKADNARELGLDYEPEQEPVAWQNKELPMEFYEYEHLDPMWHHHYRPLYAAPTKREWVGLTDDECKQIARRVGKEHGQADGIVVAFSRAIEAKLREKNT